MQFLIAKIVTFLKAFEIPLLNRYILFLPGPNPDGAAKEPLFNFSARQLSSKNLEGLF